jgi:peptidylprolyl isomerase
MNNTQTGIAVALALAVIIAFFIFPGLWPFGAPAQAPAEQPVATDTTQSTTTAMQIPDATQLQVTDEVVGTGPTLAPGDTVLMSYVGSLTDGTVFDSTAAHGGTPMTLVVGADGSLHTTDGNGLIPGWSQGVAGMKEGGTRKLIIPPALGYGAQGIPNVIPPNATLVFEVQLVKVQAGQ